MCLFSYYSQLHLLKFVVVLTYVNLVDRVYEGNILWIDPKIGETGFMDIIFEPTLLSLVIPRCCYWHGPWRIILHMLGLGSWLIQYY